jgi:hypothetical protein
VMHFTYVLPLALSIVSSKTLKYPPSTVKTPQSYVTARRRNRNRIDVRMFQPSVP